LALVPLVVQPVRSAARRGLAAALALAAAVLVAGVSQAPLPLTGEPAEPLGVLPLDSATEVAVAVWGWLAAQPLLLAGGLLLALSAAALPELRRQARFAPAGVGALLLAGTVLTGASLPASLAVALVWVLVAARAAAARR
ncbi:MAG TPA: hypothetical protein VNJ53_10385, partial [Gaiellaceae bacterium]|nr:hypothetical protein [Gaiellaceae bacterium]